MVGLSGRLNWGGMVGLYGSLNWENIKKVVGREGFEPSTNWLKANCSY
jgi:hypothetical protein